MGEEGNLSEEEIVMKAIIKAKKEYYNVFDEFNIDGAYFPISIQVKCLSNDFEHVLKEVTVNE